MSKTVQWKRGNANVSATYVGAEGEITVDTTDYTINVHDGLTPGGYKVTGIGGGNIGNLNVNDQTITALNNGQDIYINPTGGGALISNASIQTNSYFIGNGYYITGLQAISPNLGNISIVNQNLFGINEPSQPLILGQTFGTANVLIQGNLSVANASISIADISDANISGLHLDRVAVRFGTNLTNTVSGYCFGNSVLTNVGLFHKTQSAADPNVSTIFINHDNPVAIFYSNLTNELIGNLTVVGSSREHGVFANAFVSAYSNVTSYSQILHQNLSEGTEASTDFVATANNGDDATYYVDLGIAGNLHTDTEFFGDTTTFNDAYLYVTGYNQAGPSTGNIGNLIIGSTNGIVKTFIGNTAEANVVTVVTSTGLLPGANVVYSLGSSTRQWKDLWVSNSTIYLGGVSLSVSADGNLLVNGNTVSGGGNANVSLGNFVFSANSLLNFNGGNYTNGDLSHGHTAAVILPLNGSNNPIQILNTYSNVTVSSGSNSSITGTWTFDNSGRLLLPTGGKIVGVTANNNGYLTWEGNSSGDGLGFTTMTLVPDDTVSSQVLVLDPTAPGHIHLRAPGIGGNIEQPAANIFLGSENTSFEVTAQYALSPEARIHSGNNTWRFDNTGAINLANIGVVRRQDSVNFVSNGWIQMQWVDTGNLNIADPNGTTGPTNWVYLDQNGLHVEANVNTGGTQYAWDFTNDGNLNLPGSTARIKSNANVVNVYSDIGNLNGLEISANNETNLFNQNRVQIISNVGATSKVWEYSASGNLISPNGGVIGAIDSNDPNSFGLKAGGSVNYVELNYGNDQRIYVDSAGSYIGTNNQSSQYLWSFRDDGWLTLPGSLSATGNITGANVVSANTFVSNAFNVVTAGNLSITSQYGLGTTGTILEDNGTLELIAKGGGSVVAGWDSTYGNGLGNIATINFNEVNGGEGNILLRTGDRSATEYNWKFDNTGVLTLPGEGVLQSLGDSVTLASLNTTTGNINSMYLSSGGGVGFFDQAIGGNWLEIFRSGAEPLIRVPVGRGNLLIQTAEGINSYNWTFSANGDLDLPGSLSTPSNVTVNDTLFVVGSIQPTGASPAPYLSGFSSISTVISGNANEGNITAHNYLRANGGIITTGNITGGNLSVTGNIAAQYFVGNGSLLTGISAGSGNYGDSNVSTFLASLGSNSIVTTGNITGGNISSAAGKNIVLGNASSQIRQIGSNSLISLSGSITLTPDTAASALNGVIIGGSGYLLAPNGARNLTLNYNSDSGHVGLQTNATVGSAGSGGVLNIAGTLVTGANAIVAGITNTVAFPNTTAKFSSNVDSYSQMVAQNKSNGTRSTTDYVATANNGTDSIFFVDLGIAGNSYDNASPSNSLGTLLYANDSYLYAQGNTSANVGGNLVVGASTAGKVVKIFANGINTGSIVATFSNTGIDVTGNVTSTGNLTAGNISVTGNIIGNVNGFTIGYRDIPQVTFTSNATLALTDAGKHYFSSNSANVITVPNNATVSFNVGAAISIVQQGTANLTISPASGVTLYLAGNTTSGSRTLGSYGMATIMKVATDTWFINGTGLA